MKKVSIIVIIFILNMGFLAAQNIVSGSSEVISDARIDSLLQLHIDHNTVHPVFQGYRIQILMASGNDALEITETAKTEFLELYPDTPVYLTFGEPDYRLRVGDYRTRLEAEKFLETISRKYPGAWVIQDNINFPILPKYKNINSYE